MDDLPQTRDFRRSGNPNYNFKGNTMRLHGKVYVGSNISCRSCKGICMMTDFYDKKENWEKYKEMFDPKYHRRLIKQLQDAGIAPDSNGFCHSLRDFLERDELEKEKAKLIETQGYDPDSEEFLSQKQKAKRRKLKRREKEEEEAKFAEEWVDKAYDRNEFKETLKLNANKKLSVADFQARRQKVRVDVHSEWYPESRFFRRKNQLIGVRRYRKPSRDYFVNTYPNKEKKKDLMDIQMNDPVLDVKDREVGILDFLVL